MKLDLGGTACYESLRAVGISLDGSMSDDEVTPCIVGDYNLMPFPNNTFKEAEGSCYLEEKPNWGELFRVMEPGGIVRVKACDAGYAPVSSMEADMKAAGFIILDRGFIVDEEYGFDNPYVLAKPFEKRGIYVHIMEIGD